MCRRLPRCATARSDRFASRLPPAKLAGFLHDGTWIRLDDGDGPLAVPCGEAGGQFDDLRQELSGVRACAVLTGGPSARIDRPPRWLAGSSLPAKRRIGAVDP